MALSFVDTEKMVCLEKAKIKATGMWEPMAGEPLLWQVSSPLFYHIGGKKA